ncbi:cell division protein methyltransferase FtsJ [Deferribacter desulfuricans SSM1]|uniref:Ribosomal RNA large subunit methyltransferase E n=1 Tax=Deferribacter desulfuricans (strain DSM 14783 / JCM 11476 / NBRC 101012 / SSM1) TaxID=639282 RepID=D3PAB1_DEFDS|nr:RlmE family RNA methyltransferase [Deferribacter desulfuricans]BAI79534.1 cell division protein methyltransferase FtsJ [Deferribacter desulfuricans SSM1]
MYKRKDGYYKKAKHEGFRSRAAYKLSEINNKYRIIKKGDKVLDAGCAPGGWSQAAISIVGDKGLVVGIDILDISPIEAKNFYFIKGNLLDKETLKKSAEICKEYDTVISDAAPNTTGNKLTDHVNSLELVSTVFNFAKEVLKPEGNFLFKLFDGEDREDFIKQLRTSFKKVKIIRPDATRKNSFEIYVVCQGFKK